MQYNISEVVLMFARQGVPLETIAKAIAREIEPVKTVCQEAIANSTLGRMPPYNANPYYGLFNLGKNEAKIVYLLTRHAPVTRTMIFQAIWGDADNQPNERIIDVLMVNIRKKLDRIGVVIDTLRGIGFQMTRADVNVLDRAAEAYRGSGCCR